MRVLIASNSGWNLKNFREDLIEKLINEGQQIEVVSPLDDSVDYLINLGCTYNRLDFKGRSVNLFKELRVFCKALSIVFKKKPDAILTFTIKPNIYFGLIARILNIPTICTVTGLGRNFIGSRLRSSIYTYLYKLALRKIFFCFFQNSDDRNFFIKNNIITKTKAKIINGSGINLQKFNPKIFKEHGSELKNDEFQFLYVGRIIEDKGLFELFEAAEALRRKYTVQIKLIGAFDEKVVSKNFKQTFKGAIFKGSIQYVDFVDDIRPYLNNTDCLVQPSYREGSSKSILEGMAMELPIVATNVPGCNNLVENHYSGLLCQPKNASDLYLKMESILNISEKKRKEMGARGRKKIEKEFDMHLINSKYIQSLELIRNTR